MNRTYLGYGVYAEHDGYNVVLIVPPDASSDGREQRIYLEPAVLTALNQYVQGLRS